MALFRTVVEACVASKDLDQANLSRLAFWMDELGKLATITAEDVDAGAGPTLVHTDRFPLAVLERRKGEALGTAH